MLLFRAICLGRSLPVNSVTHTHNHFHLTRRNRLKQIKRVCEREIFRLRHIGIYLWSFKNKKKERDVTRTPSLIFHRLSSTFLFNSTSSLVCDLNSSLCQPRNCESSRFPSLRLYESAGCSFHVQPNSFSISLVQSLGVQRGIQSDIQFPVLHYQYACIRSCVGAYANF